MILYESGLQQKRKKTSALLRRFLEKKDLGFFVVKNVLKKNMQGRYNKVPKSFFLKNSKITND
jgi:hypothetical protein